MPKELAFENWAVRQGKSVDKEKDGMYSDPFVNDLYMSWCACRELCASLCDEVASICEESSYGARRYAAVFSAKSCANIIRGNTMTA